MEQLLFDQYLQNCTIIEEATTCLETFIYTDPDRIHVTKESTLEHHEFDDFIHQTGRFKTNEKQCRGGIRLILQGNAKEKDTFEPGFLSLPNGFHQKLVEGMGLPYSWIETLSAVGPFYWSSVEVNGGKPYLQIIYRKSDVKKPENPRNWELVLSHSLMTGITNAFFKGTQRSDVNRCIACLRQCIGEIDHPMFLPALIFSLDIDAKEDERHRKNRERVRNLEKVVTEASHIYADPDFTKRDKVKLAEINSSLVDCHKEVLWKRPEGYITIIDKMKKTMADFRNVWPEERRERLEMIHPVMERRLELLMSKLQGISTHREVNILRLKLIENVLQNLVSLSIFRQEQQMRIEKVKRQDTMRIEQSKEEERRETKKAQRAFKNMLETRKQTAIALLGVIFLPGTFLAAIFSTTFFDFQSGDSAGVVSKKFYIYWATTIPMTLFLFVLWLFWQKRAKQILEEREKKIHDVEEQIKRTQTSIWDKETLF